MPRLTSLFASPCVATTRLSFTATITPQPTPQKRHGALDHVSFAASASVITFCAAAGNAMPATVAAALAADCRMNSLREMLMGTPSEMLVGARLAARRLGLRDVVLAVLIDENRSGDTGHPAHVVDRGDHRRGVGRLQRDHELAFGTRRVNACSLQRGDRGRDARDLARHRVH